MLFRVAPLLLLCTVAAGAALPANGGMLGPPKPVSDFTDSRTLAPNPGTNGVRDAVYSDAIDNGARRSPVGSYNVAKRDKDDGPVAEYGGGGYKGDVADPDGV